MVKFSKVMFLLFKIFNPSAPASCLAKERMDLSIPDPLITIFAFLSRERVLNMECFPEGI